MRSIRWRLTFAYALALLVTMVAFGATIYFARQQTSARNFDQRMKDLAESKDALIAQFREIGDQLLDKAHKDFLEKAGERFTAADKASETKLKELLAPVETTLKRYEEGLQRVEKERAASAPPG